MTSRAVEIPFLDLRALNAELADELEEAALRVLTGPSLILGPELEAFEAEYAAFVGTRHCVGVGCGLDALSLTLEAWGIGPGDDVLVPASTYVATWLAVTRVGARPVPVEPDEATGNMDPDRVREALTPATRAVVPVHLHGRPADLAAIADAVRPREVLVLEDAAQAHGARLRDRRAGALADAGAWSFYPAKNLGAFGDGGAVTTDDERLAERLRTLRNYGLTAPFRHELRGVNSRLDELQAALLRVKLPHLDAWNARRREVARVYLARLADAPDVALPTEPLDGEHVWHVLAIRVADRDGLRDALARRGVGTHCHYPVPPHLQPALEGLDIARGTLPIAERIARTTLSLPISPALPPADAAAVADAILDERRR